MEGAEIRRLLVTAAVVLTGPMAITALAATGVSVQDTMEAIGVSSPEPAAEAPAPQIEAPQQAVPDQPSARVEETGLRHDAPTRSDDAQPPAEPASPGDPPTPAEPEAVPEAPAAVEEPEGSVEPEPEPPAGPLDDVKDPVEDALGGAKAVLNGGAQVLLP